MAKSNFQPTNKRKYFNRGNRCYGLPLKNLSMIFLRGLRSWSEPQLWKFLNNNFSDIFNSIISVKHTNNFGDTFFRIKVQLPIDQANTICEKLETLIPYVKASCNRVSHFINKKSFKNIKRGLLCNKPSVYNITSDSASSSSASFTPTLLNNITQSSPTSSNSDTSSNNKFSSFSDPLDQKFSFCLSWNTNGWNFVKRHGIEYFNILFKPLFLCFQETGNGSKLNDDIFCKVTMPNYRYFRKKAIKSQPGMRGLYLGYHKSCLASVENNEFNYILSLTTYSLWNHAQCSIGNVYVPQKKHNLERKIAFTEIASWLNKHSNHAAILLGDFNCSKEDLHKFISPFIGWTILPISGSTVSWVRGDYSSDIDHAIINTHISNRLSSAIFVDYFPISDHKPLLVQCH